MMHDDGEPAPSPAATEEEAAAEEEALPHVQPAQQVAVPETSDGDQEGQVAVTPDANPTPTPESPVGQPVSPSSPVAAPPAPTPTPNLSPREGKAAEAPAGADVSAAARPGSASGTASRTICLRTLRGNKSSGALSSLDGWGGTTVTAAPAVTAAGGAVEQGVQSEAAAAAVGAGVVGGLGVLPSTNKVVDLREVKKVKPGPLASAAAAPVPADDSDGPEEGAGPVKIDISAGKRMIEFQLKQNAAEEKREAARLKSERERADAAAAEGSQRMLAQVNARIEAQRRAGGGVLGSRGNENLAARGIGQSQIRNLAEKHGIVVKFVDDGAASGVAQVRALAQAHGIRIRILGHDSGGGGGGGGGPLDGEDGEAPVGGDGADKAATPPPILSSLRTRAAPARRSPSPVPETLKKAPRRTPAAPAGGMFSGPARMMRRALEASGGCVPSGKDESPEASRGEITSFKPSSAGDGDGDDKESSPSGSRGGVVRPRPGSGGSSGSAEAASNGAVKGGVVARSEGESCSSVEGAAVIATAASDSSNALNVSGRKRRDAPGNTNQMGETEERVENAAGTTSKRGAGAGDVGGSSGGAGGGRMEGRLGRRNADTAECDGGATPSARESKEAATPRAQNGAPKRMRLVAPDGVVVSQASEPPSTQRSSRRASSGGTAWGPGNNNLFKGAMAGIMGRGKRPSP